MHCYQFTGRWRIGSCDCWCYASGISGRHLHVVLHAPRVVFAHLEDFCHEHWNVGVILRIFFSSNTPMLRTLIVSALESCFSWFISLRFAIQMIVVVDCTQLLSCFEGLVPVKEKKKKFILQLCTKPLTVICLFFLFLWGLIKYKQNLLRKFYDIFIATQNT